MDFLHFALFYLNWCVHIHFRIIPTVYYSGLLNKYWMSNWSIFAFSSCPAEGLLHRRNSKFSQSTHSFSKSFFFLFYFNIQDVIVFIKVSESGMEGYSQNIKSLWSIGGKILSSRHVAQRTAKIGLEWDQNIQWKTLEYSVKSYVAIQAFEAGWFLVRKEVKGKPSTWSEGRWRMGLTGTWASQARKSKGRWSRQNGT